MERVGRWKKECVRMCETVVQEFAKRQQPMTLSSVVAGACLLSPLRLNSAVMGGYGRWLSE